MSDDDLNALFASAWDEHTDKSHRATLAHSLSYICAYSQDQLVGFVNLAWDGGTHGFILDTTVRPDFQRRGIGRQLVERAATVAKERNLEWLHVDYEPQLELFYQSCGFRETAAGVLRLRGEGA